MPVIARLSEVFGHAPGTLANTITVCSSLAADLTLT